MLNSAANLSIFEVKELVSACAEGKAEINDGTCWSLRGLQLITGKLGDISKEIAIKNRDNDQQNHWV